MSVRKSNYHFASLLNLPLPSSLLPLLPRQPLLNFLLLLEEVRSSPSFVEEDFRLPAENCEAFRAIGEGQGPFPLISLYLLRHAAQPRAHHSADVWPPSRCALFICVVVYRFLPPYLPVFCLLPAIKHAVEFANLRLPPRCLERGSLVASSLETQLRCFQNFISDFSNVSKSVVSGSGVYGVLLRVKLPGQHAWEY